MARGLFTSIAAILVLVAALSAAASATGSALLAPATVLPPLEPAAAMLQALGLSGLAALGSRRS